MAEVDDVRQSWIDFAFDSGDLPPGRTGPRRRDVLCTQHTAMTYVPECRPNGVFCRNRHARFLCRLNHWGLMSDAHRAHPGGVVSRPRTGGTVDASTTVAGPAIHSKSEAVRLECETSSRSVVGWPREEGYA